MTTAAFTCVDCGELKPSVDDALKSWCGYGVSKAGQYVCYACCSKQDAKRMRDEGRITLYWDGKEVSNWPGTLVFVPTHVRKGRHNIARTMQTVYFDGPDGSKWYGRIFGDNTMILHCKRMKEKTR